MNGRTVAQMHACKIGDRPARLLRVESRSGLGNESANGRGECLADEGPIFELTDICQRAGWTGDALIGGRCSRGLADEVSTKDRALV